MSDAITDEVSRVLPGSPAFWRPVGRLAVLGGIAAVSRAGAHKVLGGIERKGEAFETAFDLAPPIPGGEWELGEPRAVPDAVQGRAPVRLERRAGHKASLR